MYLYINLECLLHKQEHERPNFVHQMQLGLQNTYIILTKTTKHFCFVCYA